MSRARLLGFAFRVQPKITDLRDFELHAQYLGGCAV